MSHFFQRLAQQSGIRVPDAPPPPTPPAAIPPPSAAAPAHATIAQADVTELHEERVIDPAARTIVSRTIPFSDSRLTTPSTPGPEVSVTSEATPAASPPPVVVRESETFSIRNDRSEAPPVSPSPPIAVKPMVIEAQPGTPRPAATAERPSVDPSEIMQAVMNWIAAGSAPKSPGSMPNAAPTPLDANAKSASQTETRSAAPPTLEPRPAPPVPERVIKLVEQATETSRPSEPARAIVAPLRREAQPLPPPAPSSEPIQVSIGSIQVRVEAPVAAPARPVAPARRPTEPRRDAAPKPRTSGFSQLRRHYIIPH